MTGGDEAHRNERPGFAVRSSPGPRGYSARRHGSEEADAPDGTRIAYQLQGQGAPPVQLAGQANDHHWWDAVRADFHAARSTLTLDYRGTGDSDKPDTPYSNELFAQDVITVLDELGIDRADVYGMPASQ